MHFSGTTYLLDAAEDLGGGLRDAGRGLVGALGRVIDHLADRHNASATTLQQLHCSNYTLLMHCSNYTLPTATM